ncbi:MAG: hypothetical protein Q4B68_08150 [Bacteroidales bacterium]|nr:hypothetical protein [Bacteroidales bacterium]
MKVKSLLVAALAALSMSASAVVLETEKVVIDEVNAKVGEKVEVPVRFETTTEFSAVQAFIALPEGVVAETMYNEDLEEDELVTKLANSRWNASHDISSSYNATTNTIGIVAVSLKNKMFKVGTDAMCKVCIKASAAGTFKGKIQNVHWSTASVDGSGDGDGPETEFNIVVAASAVNDITAADAAKTYKVIENGQIYIIAGDKKFNVMGAEVK